MTKTVFTEMQKSYDYFPLNNGMADVFIRAFDHEEETEYGIQYVYYTNEFRVDQTVITEPMVAADPMKYLNYIPPSAVTDSERLEALELAMLDLMGVNHD